MIATFILIGLTFIKLGINLTRCEKVTDFISAIIACGLMLTLYYYAGLFDKLL